MVVIFNDDEPFRNLHGRHRMMLNESIIFEDEQILVVTKPPGLATQAPREFDSLEARVRAYLLATSSQTSDSDRPPYLGIPHRLDRCASGIIVFAKRRKAAQRLSRQFEAREVGKVYLADVAGQVEPSSGDWRDYLRKIPDEPRGEVVATEHTEGKLAVLQFEVQARSESASRLRIRLETGRMHQIRIQCASRGFPVVGDVLYGSDRQFGPSVEHERDRQIALHAWQLTFLHPSVRETMTFESPLPEHWETMEA